MGTYTKAQLEAELTRIKNAVASCRTAIYNKGVTSIPANPTLSQLATYANLIECSHPDILLKYIGNGNTASSARGDVYFDTGFKGTYDMSFDAVFSKSVSGSDGMMFGADDSTSTSYFFIPLHASGYLFWYTNALLGNTNWKQAGTNTSYVNNFAHYSNATTKDYGISSYNYINLNTGTYSKNAGSGRSGTTANNLYLFARNKGTSVDCKAPQGSKLRYISFYKSGQLIAFFIPVLHWNNGQYVPCFYDKVNDTYHYNLGTGTPTYEQLAGNVLDYMYYNVNKTNTAYGYKTPFLITANMRISAAMSISATGYSDTNEQHVVGNRVDGNNKFGIYSKTSSALKYGLKGKASSLYNLQAANDIVSDKKYNITGIWAVSTGTKLFSDYPSANYNVTTTSYPSSSTTTNTTLNKNVWIMGNQNVCANNRCYYAIISSIDRKTTRAYVPILDLNSNKVCFYDICNLDSEIEYNGSQSSVSYQLLD